MRWIINGAERWHNDGKYKIVWEKSAPSSGSQYVKDFLKNVAQNHMWYEEYRLPTCRLRVDFLCASKKVAIEFNGRQHNEFVKFFAGNRDGFLRQFRNDCKKRKILEENGYTVIELEESDFPLTRQWFVDKYQIYW
jgi:hypothetical protein